MKWEFSWENKRDQQNIEDYQNDHVVRVGGKVMRKAGTAAVKESSTNDEENILWAAWPSKVTVMLIANSAELDMLCFTCVLPQKGGRVAQRQ